jgi:hypothetical protein
LIDLKTKPTKKQCQKKKFERLSKYRLLVFVSIGKPRIHSGKESAAFIQKSKPFRLTCSDIKSEHFEKPEKSFPILSCFRRVVYSLQRYRRFAVYKEMQKKRHRKENRKTVSVFSMNTVSQKQI